MEEEKVVAVDRRVLFPSDCFEGFRPCGNVDYESRIFGNYVLMERAAADKDVGYKQLVSYTVIVNPDLKQIFSFQRSGDLETRLDGKWSLGAGGHVNESDTQSTNPIHRNIERELDEEVYVEIARGPERLGYLNEEIDEVGRSHFGILYVVETIGLVWPKWEMANAGMRTIEEIEGIFSKGGAEYWALFSLDPLKKHLGK